jgi:hypothetical protein
VASPYRDNDVLPVQEEVKIIDVKIALRPVPLGGLVAQKGVSTYTEKICFLQSQKNLKCSSIEKTRKEHPSPVNPPENKKKITQPSQP